VKKGKMSEPRRPAEMGGRTFEKPGCPPAQPACSRVSRAPPVTAMRLRGHLHKKRLAGRGLRSSRGPSGFGVELGAFLARCGTRRKGEDLFCKAGLSPGPGCREAAPGSSLCGRQDQVLVNGSTASRSTRIN
jgi:hypothetical protein